MRRASHMRPLLLSMLIVALGSAAYLVGVPFLDLMELKTVDLRFLSRGPQPPSPEVVLAVIDEKSLLAEGKWMWPRTKFAALVEKLSEAGARVVAFDVGFLEPDDRRILETIEEIRDHMTDRALDDEQFHDTLDGLSRQADNDQHLADAIAASEARVVLGFFFQMSAASAEHFSTDQVDDQERRVQNALYKLVRMAPGAQTASLIKTAAAAQANIAKLARATEYAGFFNMEPDPDGVVRWMFGVLRHRDGYYAPLSLMSASAFLDQPLALAVDSYGTPRIRVGSREIPTDDMGRILVNYHGPEKTFPHISITDILNDNVPADRLRDKIVMVGATTVGIYDMRVTPFGSVFPGLEIHANILSSILEQSYLRQPNWAAVFDLGAMVLAGVVLGLALARTGMIAGALASLVLFGGHILVAGYLFNRHGWILNIVYPLTVIVLIYVLITGYRYLTESRQKRFIRNAFSTYLAPSVVKQLIDSPESLDLGGEERHITAFFSDVQGFTSISESLNPKALVELLNEFLTEMTDIILRCEGTVDKFEGDAIIAFFGAPNELPNHALTACRACVDMQSRLVQLRRKWQSEGRPELKMRIGMYTGPAVVGNMGSVNRMDYTMMGDTVNTAARLEGVNKVYGTYTMVGEETRALAGDEIVARELDAIVVVGKSEPLRVYELLGYPGDIDTETRAMLGDYDRALAAYRSRRWEDAEALFAEALRRRPDDAPSRTMLERCREYARHPPEPDWNGGFVMKTK